jgi:hypothetical protein
MIMADDNSDNIQCTFCTEFSPRTRSHEFARKNLKAHVATDGHKAARERAMTRARRMVEAQVAIHATPSFDLDAHLELNSTDTNDISSSTSHCTSAPVPAISEFYEIDGQIYTSRNNRPVLFSIGNTATYDLEHRNTLEQQTFLNAIESWGLLDSENVGRHLLERMSAIQDLAEAETEEADELANQAHSGMF